MPYCAVVGCKTGNKMPGRIQYQQFSLPATKGMRAKWLENINRDFTPTPHTRICAKHFKCSDFVPAKENLDTNGKEKKKRTLKSSAIPTLFLKPTKDECETFGLTPLFRRPPWPYASSVKTKCETPKSNHSKEMVTIYSQHNPLTSIENSTITKPNCNDLDLIKNRIETESGSTKTLTHSPETDKENLFSFEHPIAFQTEDENDSNTNPWSGTNFSDFLKYCCPECDFKSIELNGFCHHITENHILSLVLFNNNDVIADTIEPHNETNSTHLDENSIGTTNSETQEELIEMENYEHQNAMEFENEDINDTTDHIELEPICDEESSNKLDESEIAENSNIETYTLNPGTETDNFIKHIRITNLQSKAIGTKNPWEVKDVSKFLNYCCSQCDFKFFEIDDFHRHLSESHGLSINNPNKISTIRKYSCPECNFNCIKLASFSQHATFNHVLSKTFFQRQDFCETTENKAVEKEKTCDTIDKIATKSSFSKWSANLNKSKHLINQNISSMKISKEGWWHCYICPDEKFYFTFELIEHCNSFHRCQLSSNAIEALSSEELLKRDTLFQKSGWICNRCPSEEKFEHKFQFVSHWHKHHSRGLTYEVCQWCCELFDCPSTSQNVSIISIEQTA